MRYYLCCLCISVPRRYGMLLFVLLLATATESVFADTGKMYRLEKTSVTLRITGQSLRTVLEEIERQTSFLFLTASGKIGAYTRIDLAPGTYTVKEALDHVLKKTRLRYRQKNNYIFIFQPGEGPRRAVANNDMALVFQSHPPLSVHKSLTGAGASRLIPGVIRIPVNIFGSLRDAA